MIGFVPQELALYPTISAQDNLAFFGRIYGLQGAALKKRITEVLALVGLSDRASDAVQTFSGGMKRRLNIAAGLIHQPLILFLDEPTVGVDPQSRNFIFEHIERLKAGGMTIIYTTHYMEEAERLPAECARLYHLWYLLDSNPSGQLGNAGKEGGYIPKAAGGSFEPTSHVSRQADAILSYQPAPTYSHAGSV